MSGDGRKGADRINTAVTLSFAADIARASKASRPPHTPSACLAGSQNPSVGVKPLVTVAAVFRFPT
jgi:hypothetical protein